MIVKIKFQGVYCSAAIHSIMIANIVASGDTMPRVSCFAALPFILFAMLAFSLPVLAQDRTDWAMTTTFKSAGKSCLLKFAVPKNGFTVSLENKIDKDKRKLVAGFNIAGLPPYLAGKKGIIRNVWLDISGWTVGGIKANWTLGSKDNNSRVSFTLPFDGLLEALAVGAVLQIDVPVANMPRPFLIDLAGSAPPVSLFQACISQ